MRASRGRRSASVLPADTARYFSKLSGYDTLRLLLSEASILVEGDSDELVVQRAYMDGHGGRLPIQDGIDVVSVGTSFLRFLMTYCGGTSLGWGATCRFFAPLRPAGTPREVAWNDNRAVISTCL